MAKNRDEDEEDSVATRKTNKHEKFLFRIEKRGSKWTRIQYAVHQFVCHVHKSGDIKFVVGQYGYTVASHSVKSTKYILVSFVT